MAERLVALVVYPGIQMLDAVGPAEVFAVANRVLGDQGYRLVVASPDGAAVRADSGLTMAADRALADLAENVDTLVVAGGFGVDAASAPDFVAEIRRVAGRSRRVCSVCSGAFLLAEAGLLAGRPATTHWLVCAELARRYPDVRVEPDRIFVRAGAVYTSAGVTAGIDLALALVEADHGADVARAVARGLVVFLQRPGGQSQFSARLDHGVAAESPLRPVLDAIAAEPAADHRAARLARRAGMSERHLGRLFCAQTGTTPARFVERVRVEAARDLLERSTLSVEAVSRRSGFGSDETMRRAFLRVLGVPPADYRARFRTT
ncbi:GlxA family transcriptional regulator [Actinokineospora iranica]|uniref:Transcriptional regulator GlxA family, contains an amidase domain and an AraC-type DNA-binding HTH domain n=1 Tax=Actinokineospora iranica TaxID=1271860 RepID=A0A1G6U620_9PSEU|nr:GlxA family transcriptional regulator [Actinokineospora iranica]SDD35985.1 Transcriptional regulator GlxA family, contains an amidase domain and an AraC-type DNA-binding HTH domain [Actinokineospora iranica]